MVSIINEWTISDINNGINTIIDNGKEFVNNPSAHMSSASDVVGHVLQQGREGVESAIKDPSSTLDQAQGVLQKGVEKVPEALNDLQKNTSELSQDIQDKAKSLERGYRISNFLNGVEDKMNEARKFVAENPRIVVRGGLLTTALGLAALHHYRQKKKSK